jgi:hypothetical protein
MQPMSNEIDAQTKLARQVARSWCDQELIEELQIAGVGLEQLDRKSLYGIICTLLARESANTLAKSSTRAAERILGSSGRVAADGVDGDIVRLSS